MPIRSGSGSLAKCGGAGGGRGVRLRQRIQRRRQYRSLFLAVDGRRGRIWYCWIDRMYGSECCGVVRGIQQAGVLDGLVWDGAPGHRDARVGRIGLPLVSLPPYSPELNPAERLFEVIRAEIEGERSTDLPAKCARVDAILARWDAHPAQVRSRAGWSWLRDALDHLPPPTTP